MPLLLSARLTQTDRGTGAGAAASGDAFREAYRSVQTVFWNATAAVALRSKKSKIQEVFFTSKPVE